jgi:hypothetical protein
MSDWISVDDRLPDVGVAVICKCHDIVNEWAQELFYGKTGEIGDDGEGTGTMGWYERNLEDFPCIVTHWQPMPTTN